MPGFVYRDHRELRMSAFAYGTLHMTVQDEPARGYVFRDLVYLVTFLVAVTEDLM